jgi:hypothetical protein
MALYRHRHRLKKIDRKVPPGWKRSTQVLAALELRKRDTGPQLHPGKTRIVHCQDYRCLRGSPGLCACAVVVTTSGTQATQQLDRPADQRTQSRGGIELAELERFVGEPALGGPDHRAAASSTCVIVS